MLVTGNNNITKDLNRLTIQLDLNGFSFKIQSPYGNNVANGSHIIPASTSNILDFMQDIQGIIFSDPALKEVNTFSANIYYRSEKYALVPKEMFTAEDIIPELSKVHNVKDSDEVMYCQSPIEDIIMVYAVPKDIITTFSEIYNHVNYYPNSILLLENTDEIEDCNHICLDQGSSIMDIAVFDQKKLKLINSFPASDFTTLLYFMIMITKEVVFNPRLTTVRVGGAIAEDTIEKLSTYYKKIIR